MVLVDSRLHYPFFSTHTHPFIFMVLLHYIASWFSTRYRLGTKAKEKCFFRCTDDIAAVFTCDNLQSNDEDLNSKREYCVPPKLSDPKLVIHWGLMYLGTIWTFPFQALQRSKPWSLQTLFSVAHKILNDAINNHNSHSKNFRSPHQLSWRLFVH